MTEMSRYSLLIIDDSEDDCFSYKRMLGKYPLDFPNVKIAKNAKEGVQHLETNTINCCLLDYRLPDADGMTVLQEIRSSKEYNEVAVIILTGQGNEALAVKFIRNGAQDYLTKGDFNAEQLYRVICRAITTNQLESKIDYLAHHDSLSGLVSRDIFIDRLQQSIHRYDRYQKSGALLYLDLDHFKRINDNYGHAIGDLVIKEMAARINKNIRETDTACRLGGDEFAVLLDNIEFENANNVAQKLIKKLNWPFIAGGNELQLSCSVGLAMYPGTAESSEELMKQADKALYDSKEGGRALVSCFSIEQLAHWRETKILERDIQFAVNDGQLSLVYQPIVSLTENKIVKVEALARWQHPQLGAISPMTFIPMFQNAGLISHFNDWLFEHALNQLKQWQTEFKDLMLSLNIPASFCHNHVLGKEFLSQLKEKDLSCDKIELEITESNLMEKPELSLQVLTELRNNGIHIAADDFGTGYSSMSYLTDLPLTTLKIDKRFLKGIPENTKNCNVVRTIIVLGKSLGLTVVAEGVEYPAQRKFLQENGCHLAQGYLIAKPMPPQLFAEFHKAYGNKHVATETITEQTIHAR